MDVIQIITNNLFSVSVVVVHQDEVAGGSSGNLACYALGKNKLPVGPFGTNLFSMLSVRDMIMMVVGSAHPLVLDIQVMTTDVVEKFRGI